MDRKELLKSPEYWTASIQMELYRQIEAFMKEKNFNKTQLAEYLGCSKGYITQLLSGDYDHKLSKFIQLSLAIGKFRNSVLQMWMNIFRMKHNPIRIPLWFLKSICLQYLHYQIK